MNRWLLLLLNATLAVLFVALPAVLAAKVTVVVATSWWVLQLWLPLGLAGFVAAVVLPTLAATILAGSAGLAVVVYLAVYLARPLVGRRTLRRWLVSQVHLPGYRRFVERVLAEAYG